MSHQSGKAKVGDLYSLPHAQNIIQLDITRSQEAHFDIAMDDTSSIQLV